MYFHNAKKIKTFGVDTESDPPPQWGRHIQHYGPEGA